jgi:hypothetical protein
MHYLEGVSGASHGYRKAITLAGGSQPELPKEVEPIEIEVVLDDQPVIESPEIDRRDIDLASHGGEVAAGHCQRAGHGAEGVQLEG